MTVVQMLLRCGDASEELVRRAAVVDACAGDVQSTYRAWAEARSRPADDTLHTDRAHRKAVERYAEAGAAFRRLLAQERAYG